ncbi:MAG: DMT family transporter [Solirubrobacteraceae bacterium]|jgi:drug/metabolite transporter (DMT)-like permease
MDALASATSSGLLLRMARHPVWLAGIASDIVGFIAQAAALRLGQLAVVQPLLVLSVVFALPLAARLSDHRVGRREAAAAALVVVALVGFLAIANPSGGRSEGSLSKWVLAGIACAAVCAPLSLLGRRGPAARRGALSGAAAGVLFAFSAALTKSVVDELHLGVVHVIASWEPYALAGVGYVSMTLNQLALNTRALAAAIASSTALDPIVSVTLGLTLFDEHLHASGLQAAGAFVALAAALLGVAVLARAEVPEAIAAS